MDNRPIRCPKCGVKDIPVITDSRGKCSSCGLSFGGYFKCNNKILWTGIHGRIIKKGTK